MTWDGRQWHGAWLGTFQDFVQTRPTDTDSVGDWEVFEARPGCQDTDTVLAADVQIIWSNPALSWLVTGAGCSPHHRHASSHYQHHWRHLSHFSYIGPERIFTKTHFRHWFLIHCSNKQNINLCSIYLAGRTIYQNIWILETLNENILLGGHMSDDSFIFCNFKY